jgi:hypothetical protein
MASCTRNPSHINARHEYHAAPANLVQKCLGKKTGTLATPAMKQPFNAVHLVPNSVMGAGCWSTRRAMVWLRSRTAACGCATAASWVSTLCLCLARSHRLASSISVHCAHCLQICINTFASGQGSTPRGLTFLCRPTQPAAVLPVPRGWRRPEGHILRQLGAPGVRAVGP